MKYFECVNRYQYKSDPLNADYIEIEAENINKAKSIYSKETKTKYTEVLCRTKKGYTQ